MPPEQAAHMRRLQQYPSDSAGGLMITEYLVYPDTARVAAVLDGLEKNARRYARYDLQYLYVTAADGTLAGVLRMRDLVFASRHAFIAAVMIPNPLCVRPDATLDELQQFFARHPFAGAPVVDHTGTLVGVIRRADARKHSAHGLIRRY